MNNITRNFLYNALYISIIIFFFFVSSFIQEHNSRPIIKISKQDSALNFNPSIVDIFSLGFKRFLTAITWMATILESDHEHYKQKDMNSWMFLRFNLIATLDPLFYENYIFGGQYLSIIKDDDIGAKKLFDKGLSYYPDDPELLKLAAFHYYFELSDRASSLVLYKQLIRHPSTPNYIVSMYTRLLSKQGVSEEVYQLLLDLYKKNEHIKFFKEKYQAHLYSVRAEIDLDCLNHNKTNCRTTDHDGNSYFLQNGKFQAKKPWVKYRINK